MKLNKWSILKTADKRGLVIKPPEGGANHYEVAVAVRDHRLEINVYVDGVDDPVVSLAVPTEE